MTPAHCVKRTPCSRNHKTERAPGPHRNTWLPRQDWRTAETAGGTKKPCTRSPVDHRSMRGTNGLAGLVGLPGQATGPGWYLVHTCVCRCRRNRPGRAMSSTGRRPSHATTLFGRPRASSAHTPCTSPQIRPARDQEQQQGQQERQQQLPPAHAFRRACMYLMSITSHRASVVVVVVVPAADRCRPLLASMCH